MLATLGRRGIPAVVAALLLVAAWTSTLDTPAMAQVDAGMQRALVSFAGARALNAVISLLQGTEVTVGVVAEVTVGIGEVLDPVNDLVESFSNLMLVASVAFGIQKVLLLIGQYAWVKYALSAVLLGWGATHAILGKCPRWLDVALLLMLMIRFAIPLVTAGSDAVYTHFLQQDYANGQGTITTMTDDLKQYTAPGSIAALDPRPIIDRITQAAANTTDYAIKLIVVFLLQTVLVPLFLVWALYLAMRSVLVGGRGS